MAIEFSKDSPYIHSNYYLFCNQLRDYYFNVDKDQGISKMQEQIRSLKQVRDQLYTTAQNFLGGDTPELAWRHIKQNDSALSKIGKEVVGDPRAKQALMGTMYDKKIISEITKKETQVADYLAQKIAEEIDLKSLANEISEFLFSQGFGSKNKKVQIEELKSIFNLPEKEIEQILDKYIKGKLRSSQGNIQKIIKEIVKQHQQNNLAIYSNQAYLSFINYFKKAVREKAQAGGIYSINDSIVERYLKKMEKELLKVINKSTYYSTDASRSLGEEIISTVNDNKLLIMLPGGEKTENNFRKDLLPSLETATTWTDPNKMSYSDMVLINKDGMRVRAQSKNYVGAYEAFLQTKENIYQQTHLFSREMLFKDFFNKLAASGNIVGDIDLDYLSYIVANEVWFDTHGSMDRGGNKGFRQNGTHTRLFGTDSWLSRALSGAFINFLGIVVSEGVVISDVSNIFFLIDNQALVPTYELIDNVIKYYENGIKEITNIHINASTKSADFIWDSPLQFLQTKAEAAGGLGPATYESKPLVRVGRTQGARIMSTLKVNSVNLGVNLEKLLTSAWTFKT